MNITQRRMGRIIRKSSRPALLIRIAKLDRAWRLDGKREGRLENSLAFELGNAASHGMYDASRKIQIHSAAQLGQLSGWESHYSA